jgi:hypothetical protein
MFKVWAPLCLALIKYVPNTVLERSIEITMRRKPRSNGLKRLVRKDRDERAATLARRAARWAADHMVELTDADPALPEALTDRAQDNWRALTAIADLVGLGEAARAAALALALPDDADADLVVQLLADIRTVFDANPHKNKLPSSAIVGSLLMMEDRPWPEMGEAQRPLSKAKMARLLNPLGVRPVGTLRDGKDTFKGYWRATFEGAWASYGILSSDVPPSKPSHRRNPSGARVSDDSEPSHADPDVTVSNGLEASDSADCDGVTVQKGVEGGEFTNNSADAEIEAVIAGMADGSRCGHCLAALGNDPAEVVDGRRYHSNTCATTARAKATTPAASRNGAAAPDGGAAPPKRAGKRRRIRGADTTPRTEGLD